MASIVDVAAYILDQCKSLSTMKLQKLTFYSQAHSLATLGTPLFNEDFEAWRAGPVSTELFSKHRGFFIIEAGQLKAKSTNLTDQEKNIVDAVCNKLGKLTGNDLSNRSHREDPWKNARSGLSPSAPSQNLISKDSIREYYSIHRVVDF